MRIIFFAILILSASRIDPFDNPTAIVIWNVGQGQWVTIAEGDTCLHLDAGGERFPWKKIELLCQHRKNHFYLSHWDWDHISALATPLLKKTLPTSCLAQRPQGSADTKKMKTLASYESCESKDFLISKWTPQNFQNSNDSSHVYIFAGLLSPGDSSTHEEAQWISFAQKHHPKVLILGHHGSKTSTSEKLLASLPQINLAISSARWKRYHHPHFETCEKLKRHRIPLLKTEDWGNLWLDQRLVQHGPQGIQFTNSRLFKKRAL